MIFELVDDFSEVLQAMPHGHFRVRILNLLCEAMRRDVNFIERHPTTLFQCLWNTCWWHDCSELSSHLPQFEHRPQLRYLSALNGVSVTTGSGSMNSALKENVLEKSYRLSTLMESIRACKELHTPNFPWARALRPPTVGLDSAQIAVADAFNGTPIDLAFSLCGSEILYVGIDRLAIFESRTGRLKEEHRFSEAIRCAVLDPHARVAVCESTSHTLNILRFSDGAIASSWPTNQTIKALTITGDGSLIGVAYLDGLVEILTRDSLRRVACTRCKSGPVNLCFSPDQRLLVGEADQIIRFWNAQTGIEEGCFRRPTYEEFVSANTAEVMLPALDLCGTMIPFKQSFHTVVAADSTSVYSASGLTLRKHELIHGNRLRETGSKTIGETGDGGIGEIADPFQGCTAVARIPDGVIRSLAIQPYGNIVVVGLDSGDLRLFDAVTLTCIGKIAGQNRESADHVRFSHDGRWIAVGASTGRIAVYDPCHLTEPRIRYRHKDKVHHIQFTDDDSRLISVSAADPILAWSVIDGRLVWASGVREDSRDQRNSHISLSPRSDRMLIRTISGTNALSGNTWLLDAETGEIVTQLKLENWEGCSFTVDGSQVVTKGADAHETKVWDARSGCKCELAAADSELEMNTLELLKSSVGEIASWLHVCKVGRDLEIRDQHHRTKVFCTLAIQGHLNLLHPRLPVIAIALGPDVYLFALEGSADRGTRSALFQLVYQVHGQTIKVRLNRPEMRLGRADDCEIRLPNKEISRYHARLNSSMEDWILHNTRSTNGVFVNEEQIQRHVLRDGDVIRIGSVVLVFCRLDNAERLAADDGSL